jgi:O-antigen/teichoic acid export membrane protein
MSVTKKTFFVQFGHFFSGQAIGMLLGLITFPILTRLLSIEQYGILGLVTNTVAIVIVFSKSGLSDGIIRFHDEYAGDDKKRITFSSTILFIGLLLTTLVASCYLISLPLIYKFLNIREQFQICFFIMTLYVFISPLNIIFTNLLRVNGKTLFLNLLNVVTKVASIVIGLFLLVVVIGKLYGFFIGVVAAEYLVFLVFISWFLRNYSVSLPSVSFSLAKHIMSFGIPLLFSELAYMLLTYADRYMILLVHGEQELGIYSVGYNLAMYVANIVVFSISFAIVPLYVKMYNDQGREETEKFLSECLYYLMILVIPVCLGYAAVSKELFWVLASEKYVTAASFSPVIVLATVILGMNSVLNAGLYLHKKSLIILLIIAFGVILNVICNYILLPKFHVMGAAYSTLIACVATSILTIIFSFRSLRVRLKADILYHGILSIIMYFLVSLISSGHVMLDLGLKIFTGAFIVAAGVLLKEKSLLSQIRARFGL